MPSSEINTAKYEWGLVFVTVLWGLTFPVIRMGLRDFDPNYFVFIRFLIATAVFFPIVFTIPNRWTELRRAMGVGLGSGALLSLTFTFQTVGLKTVPAPRAAFITATYVVLVPLFAPLFGRGRLKPRDIAAGGVALVGLWLILDPRMEGISTGDLWIIGCALASTVCIFALKAVADRPLNRKAVAFWQLAGVALVALLPLPFVSSPALHFELPVFVALGVCALGVSVGSFLIQVICQRHLSPERASLIYALEPIFALFFGYLLVGETLSPKGIVGGALIVLAVGGKAAIVSVKKLWGHARRRHTEKSNACLPA